MLLDFTKKQPLQKGKPYQTEVDVHIDKTIFVVLEIDGNVVFFGICEKILLHYLIILCFDVDS